jgi:uncharacterized RDD family membrane protein YckC
MRKMEPFSGDPTDPRRVGGDSFADEITLAKWRTRFGAWLIDVIIVFLVLAIFHTYAELPFFYFSYNYYTDDEGGVQFYFGNTTNVDNAVDVGNAATEEGAHSALIYFVDSLIFFAYWTFCESTRGQSVGKALLKIKTTDLSGKRADIKHVMIESFGKSFLLPIDVLLGWIFTNEIRQRAFNKVSDTIVIKLKPRERLELVGGGAKYVKD